MTVMPKNINMGDKDSDVSNIQNMSKYTSQKNKMKDNNQLENAQNKSILDKINQKKLGGFLGRQQGLVKPSIAFVVSTIIGVFFILLFFWVSFSVQFFFDYAWRLNYVGEQLNPCKYANLLEIIFPHDPNKYPYVFAKAGQFFNGTCFQCAKNEEIQGDGLELLCCHACKDGEFGGYSKVSTFLFNKLYSFKQG